VAENQIKLASQ